MRVQSSAVTVEEETPGVKNEARNPALGSKETRPEEEFLDFDMRKKSERMKSKNGRKIN